MKIKDVEQMVGLSAHSIRFYEEMGLLQVQRKKDSNYRDFSETDVKKLKEIKLFRSLGIAMEDIRRYYAQEITLAELMDHQLQELALQQEECKVKEELCKDIKDSHSPLVSYTVEQYENVIAHKQEKLPYEKAGSLLVRWNQAYANKHRIKFYYLLAVPFVFFFLYMLVTLVASLLDPDGTWSMTVIGSILLIITLLLVVIAMYYDWHFGAVLSKELYEFREQGIYYLNKDSHISFKEARKAAMQGTLEECYEFVSYQDIKVLKIGFHSFARTPGNGGNAYCIDFHILTTFDERITIHTGVLGVPDEKVRITAELLREHAQSVLDPYHILEHLDDDRDTFYTHLDQIWWKKEYARVGKTK